MTEHPPISDLSHQRNDLPIPRLVLSVDMHDGKWAHHEWDDVADDELDNKSHHHSELHHHDHYHHYDKSHHHNKWHHHNKYHDELDDGELEDELAS